MFGIVTDSSCDLAEHHLLRAGVKQVPLRIGLGERVVSADDLSPQALLSAQERGEAVAVQPPTPAALMAAYQEALEAHGQVLALHSGAQFGGTLSAAVQAAWAIEERLGPGRVAVIDTGLISGPLGDFVLLAARMAGAGHPLAWAAQRLLDLREHTTSLLLLPCGPHASVSAGLPAQPALGIVARASQALVPRPTVWLRGGRLELLGRYRSADAQLAAAVRELTGWAAGRPVQATITVSGFDPDELDTVRSWLEGSDLRFTRGRIQPAGVATGAFVGSPSCMVSLLAGRR